MKFTHLHLHTGASLLDSAIKVPDLIKKAKEYKMDSLAMTDHGNLFNAVQFYQQCTANEIKPIIGCELYCAPGSRFDKQKVRVGDHEAGNFHLTVLAKNEIGYQNLCRLNSRAYLEGFYYKPRVDKELLKEYREGLLVLSGCLASETSRLITSNDLPAAEEIIRWYRDIFGEDYFFEIQENHIDEQNVVNGELKGLAKKLSVGLVATFDCHIINKDDMDAHEILLCSQTKKTLDDPERWKFSGDGHYFASPKEAIALFENCPESIKNTQLIADRCKLNLKFGKYDFPQIQVPQQFETIEHFFRKSAKQGFINRELPESYRDQLNYELDSICEMGFASYMLIVADFIQWSKDNGIGVGPGRGSVAGSLVAYCLGITEVDPIKYGLIYERFINPGRKGSVPDIDCDFDHVNRDKVFQYVQNKYGHDKVAQIATFGTLKGKAALKDIGRVLGIPFGEMNELTKVYPAPKHGKEFSLEEALEMEPRLVEFRQRGPVYEKLFDTAFKLEGLLRHSSKHAAGVVISNSPLLDRIPLMKDKDDNILSQFSMTDVDTIGLIKFDFLGLKTLTLIQDTLKKVKQLRGIDIDINKIPMDDQVTYDLLCSGNTVGVFQLESSGMRNLLVRLKPKDLNDIAAANALFRPGPLDSGMVDMYINRKNGVIPVDYPHDNTKPFLEETYALFIYQEQVMKLAQVLCGYSLSEADNLRKAIGKKNREAMGKERNRFIAGAAKEGKITKELAESLFQDIEKFADYSFNKSHAISYSLLSYQTAYLKAHYPAEFMASLLTMKDNSLEDIYTNVVECRKVGIEILPPDINESDVDFTIVDARRIRFGLGAIKGIGAKAIEIIVEERKKSAFKDLYDFYTRTHINSRVLEHLIKAGAFDMFLYPRAALIQHFSDIEAYLHQINLKTVQKKIAQGILVLPIPTVPRIQEWSKAEKLKYEKQILGFFVSGHPLDDYSDFLEEYQVASIQNLAGDGEGNIAGNINNLLRKNTKAGKRYATFILEDKTGSIECVVWPETYKKYESLLLIEDPVIIFGRYSIYEEQQQFIVNKIQLLELAENHLDEITLNANTDNIEILQDLFKHNSGNTQVKLCLTYDNKRAIFNTLYTLSLKREVIQKIKNYII